MPVPTKGSPEAKAKMAAVRAARELAPVIPQEVSNEPISYGQQTKIAPDVISMIEEIKEDSVVDIYNPLTQPFEVTFAISALEPIRLTPEQAETNRKAGIDPKDGGSVGHATRTTILPPLKVTRLPGVAAQRAVYQLRNYLMSRDGQRVSDAVAKREYEEQIVRRVGSTFDDMGAVDPQIEMDKKIAQLNQTTAQQVTTGVTNGPTFPSLGLNPEAASTPGPTPVAS